MSAIRTENLRKTYGDVTALADLTLDIEDGELFGALGPNGAGKTTTIGILTGQLQPDSGTASVLGHDPVADPVETRRHVGILPEQESPPSFMTPREYFDFVATVRDVPADVLDERVEQWAQRLSFTEKLDTLSTDLSRGQQQKVMITQAFLHEPEVVFIDEPLANLDPIVQERVKRYLQDYRDRGNTLFISTHHIEVAEEICSRVGIVYEGRLIADRRPGEMDAEESLLDTFVANVGSDEEWTEPAATPGDD
ncbi:ABC transporter ATP-binding protein [Haloarchaeobius iranensis]|uniref:ABC-2 type transport system ATP-binding protein n=1 Tax=Haloarchaeobius iranensis TaxID=996166 RepID=A0A1G9UED6_9EURY|nr:ABC transporter ATP-binding protein [Haloarchaeobius iranensis]SDM58311.1 ABC-2 type transport system ATP-binding protein [Haloarchaeobius iranensis]